MSLLVDVHCHLDHKDFDDVGQIVERARQAGLKVIITSGINPETNRISLQLQERFDIVKASLGIYPVDALQNEVSSMEYPMKLEPFDIDKELDFIAQHKSEIMAIGEVGLDYESGSKIAEQKALFEKCIHLAERLNKPIIVHSRKAEADCVAMLESSRIKRVMMHCFHGRFSLVNKVIENGWYLSVPTNVVRSEHFQKIVKLVDLSRLLTETDAPYLSPFKGIKNEPSFVIETVKKIAEIKGLDPKEVEHNIFYNYERLFL